MMLPYELEALVPKHRDWLVTLTASWISRKADVDWDPHEAEDLVQESIVVLLTKGVEPHPDFAKPKAALSRWVRHQIYSVLLRGAQEPLLRARGLVTEKSVGFGLHHEVPFPVLSVEDFDIEDFEIREWAETTILDGHPRGGPRYWKIAEAVYWEGHSREEVAASEGITLARLNTIIGRVRKTLNAGRV
jgi:DNA-directed RNA polymerase specialized sigma24 family protein